MAAPSAGDRRLPPSPATGSFATRGTGRFATSPGSRESIASPGAGVTARESPWVTTTTTGTPTCSSPACSVTTCLRNRGDGTFEDATERAGLAGRP